MIFAGTAGVIFAVAILLVLNYSLGDHLSRIEELEKKVKDLEKK